MRKLLVVVVTGAVLAGGIAYASGSGGSGTIQACAKTDTGQLRLDTGSGCLPSEQPVSWSAGTSAVERWFYRGGANVPNWLPIVSGVWPDVRPSMTRVLTIHLDAGDYVISSQVIAENDQGQGIVVCMLGNYSLGFGDLVQTAVGWAPGFALQQTATAQTTYELTEPTDLDLRCFNAPPNDPAGNPKIGYADVIATKVDTISSTQEP